MLLGVYQKLVCSAKEDFEYYLSHMKAFLTEGLSTQLRKVLSVT